MLQHSRNSSICTELIFVEPGIKINGQYYRDILLTQSLLPSIRSIAGEYFVFQQTVRRLEGLRKQSRCCHRIRQISFRRFSGLPTVRTWTPWTIEYGGCCKSACIRHQWGMWNTWSDAWMKSGGSSISELSIAQWTSGISACEHVSQMQVDTSSTCCDSIILPIPL